MQQINGKTFRGHTHVQAVLDPRKTANKPTGYRWNLLCRYARGVVITLVVALFYLKLK